MKDTLRQFIVILTIFATLAINGLANSVPFNGITTGQVSYQFDIYFVPAGYVFSIWGWIYLGLVLFAIFQALPSQKQNPRLRKAGKWISLSGLANCAWIFLWHYQQFLLTVLVMLVLLTSLIMAYLRLGIGRLPATITEELAARLPVRIYLGWITVATIANVTIFLEDVRWNRFGFSPELWMGILLAAVLFITALVNITRRDSAYTAVILWALSGISAKHAAVAAVTIPTWITFGMVILTLGIAFALPKANQKVDWAS